MVVEYFIEIAGLGRFGRFVLLTLVPVSCLRLEI